MNGEYSHRVVQLCALKGRAVSMMDTSKVLKVEVGQCDEVGSGS